MQKKTPLINTYINIFISNTKWLFHEQDQEQQSEQCNSRPCTGDEEDETSLDLAGEIFENNFDFFKGRLNSMMTFLVPNGFWSFAWFIQGYTTSN